MNNTQDYYTLAEIITGLRDEYRNNRKILQEILELTEISTPFEVNPEIFFVTKGYKHGQKVRLKLVRGLPIKYKVEKILKEKCGFQYHTPIIICPSFNLEDTNGLLNWQYSSAFGEKCSKNILVNVTDEEKMRFLVTKLKNTYMYNFNEIFGDVNNGQFLIFGGSYIELGITTGGKNGFNLTYNAVDDTIEIDSDIPYDSRFIYHVLSLGLPKDLFSDTVIMAIEENLNKQESLSIIDDINYCKEKTILEFSNPQKLTLKPSQKK